MCLIFFSMRWQYTATFRCVAVIFGFFPKRIKPMISWQPLLLYFFRFLVFAQNRPQKNDDDLLEWWKGQEKITGNKKLKSAKNTEWPFWIYTVKPVLKVDTLRECCSVLLLQGVCLIQVSTDDVIWGVKCHSNEQWKSLEYSQRLWRYTFALIYLL